MIKIEIFIDGASKGNPGPSGIGAVILRDGEVIRNISRYIGEATNNVAEYSALIYSLRESLELKADSVKINTDSELMFRQINKIYKVKHPQIIKLHEQATRLMQSFKNISINHIPREQNEGADKLATKAVKEALKNKAGDSLIS
jgi:ribonuclease HI